MSIADPSAVPGDASRARTPDQGFVPPAPGELGPSPSAASRQRPAEAPAEFGPGLVRDAIQALIELDAEHLESLASAAERLPRESWFRLTPQQRVEMGAQVRLFCALLGETRRNLRVMAHQTNLTGNFGYTPGYRAWAD